MRKLRHGETKQLAHGPTVHNWCSLDSNPGSWLQPILFATLLSICLSTVAPRGLINSGSIKRITESRSIGETLHYTLCWSDYTWGHFIQVFLEHFKENWNLSSREQEREEIGKRCPKSMEWLGLFGLERKFREHTYTIRLKCQEDPNHLEKMWEAALGPDWFIIYLLINFTE